MTILIVLGVVVLVLSIVAFRSFTSQKPPETPQPTPTPSIVVTPTPPQNLSRIASTSAFLEFGGEVASLSAVLNAFVLQDATLAPPILETDIEFAQ